jgi:type II secretory pathway component GspD/PulD (secretin)
MKMRKTILFLCFLLMVSGAKAQQEQTNSNVKTLLSSEGKLLYGNEPNSIVVIDYPENLQRVSEYLDMVDVAPQQVFIEARVVEVKLQKEHALGINWEAFMEKGYMPLGQFMVGSQWQNALLNNAPSPLTQNLPLQPVFYPPGQTTSGETQPFTVSIFDDNINVVLKAITNSLDTDVLSAPKITTVNNREAKLEVIQKYPWAEPNATTSESGAVTVTWTIHWEDIGITLTVTPTINENGDITMVLAPVVSEKTGDFPLTVSSGGTDIKYNVPIIDKRTASTKVVVGSGKTLILGGLIKDKTTLGQSKVPLLADIPFMGNLFKTKKETKDKTELLIFVSPAVLTPETFVHMAKQERYGAGERFVQDREARQDMLIQKEKREKANEHMSLDKLEALSRKHAELMHARQLLEQDIMKESQDLKSIEKMQRAPIAAK